MESQPSNYGIIKFAQLLFVNLNVTRFLKPFLHGKVHTIFSDINMGCIFENFEVN